MKCEKGYWDEYFGEVMCGESGEACRLRKRGLDKEGKECYTIRKK